MGPVSRTRQTVKVLELFLSNPRRERYSYEVGQETGIQRSTVREMLERLAGHGWFTVRTEPGSAHALGSPPRTYYKLTRKGIKEARALLGK